MDDQGPRALYLALMLMLVASSLVGMRLPLAKVAKMALAWVAIFGAAFVIFAFRNDFSALGQRLRAEATGAPMLAGEEMRIPMAEDGHFWVRAEINGHSAPFLVDSGASVTTVSAETAENAGLETGLRIEMVSTANGSVMMKKSRADRLQVGPVTRTDFAVNINDRDDTNVLGMNFLSSLSSWRVEGNYLVLRA